MVDDTSSSSSETNATTDPTDIDKLSWRTKDVIDMVQLVVSDDIAAKFSKTKKRHLDIWNGVAKQLVPRTGMAVTGKQVRDKFNQYDLFIIFTLIIQFILSEIQIYVYHFVQ